MPVVHGDLVRGASRVQGRAVLIVEDEADVLDVLADIVQRGGHIAIRARDGVEALTILDRRRPDLILCDRIMPRMSGFELLEVIRAEHPELNAVPFVFLTALGDQRDVRATEALAPAAYLTKPTRARVLLDIIDTLVGASAEPRDIGDDDDVAIAGHGA